MLEALSDFLSEILHLSAPISISHIEKNESEQRLDVYLLVSKSYAPTPSSIGEGYYYGRTWRHLDCFEYACYLH